MPLEATPMAREFLHGKTTLPDPAPTSTPDQVRELYAATYPELTNAVVDGPKQKGNRLVYTFEVSAGSKG